MLTDKVADYSQVDGLSRNVEWFRGGLVFKAHRLLYHSTLGSRVLRKKKKDGRKPEVGDFFLAETVEGHEKEMRLRL